MEQQEHKYFTSEQQQNADPFGSPSADNDPFSSATSRVWDDTEQDDTGYVMTAIEPMDFADEVEDASTASVEVMVLWGDNVLHVAHLTPPRDFYVGEAEGRHVHCDVLVPEDKLGSERAPVVLVHDGAAHAVILDGAKGWVQLPGEGKLSVQELKARDLARPCAQAPGAYEVRLPLGAKANIEMSGQEPISLKISSVAAGKRPGAGFMSGRDGTTMAFVGLSAMLHVGILAAMGLFMPNMSLLNDESSQSDRVYLMQQYLNASAEREQIQREETPTEDVDDKAASTGGTGTRSKGEEGLMGNPNSRATNKSYTVAGPKDNPNPTVARERALDQARHWGMIGLLNASAGGDPNAPTAPWGSDEALGNDPLSARGNMWGDMPGEAYGVGGLGLSGIGESGGGRGLGIGLGSIGTIGHGAGDGTGQGFGHDHGRLGPRRRHHHGPRLRMGHTDVNGRLPPEVIQRVVRQNYGRFRFCYETALRSNPSLRGRVTVRFVIGRDGAVSQVSDAGSDLPDRTAVGCVTRAYYGLSFPAPENGIVTVVYPVSFIPES